MFSGFYSALLLILALVIVRVVSFEWRHEAGAAVASGRDVDEHSEQRRRVVNPGSRGGHLAQRRAAHFAAPCSGEYLDLFSAYTMLAGVSAWVCSRARSVATICNAVAAHYALKVITIMAVIFTWLVLVCQGWAYYVLRTWLGGEPVASPVVVAMRARPPALG